MGPRLRGGDGRSGVRLCGGDWGRLGPRLHGGDKGRKRLRRRAGGKPRGLEGRQARGLHQLHRHLLLGRRVDEGVAHHRRGLRLVLRHAPDEAVDHGALVAKVRLDLLQDAQLLVDAAGLLVDLGEAIQARLQLAFVVLDLCFERQRHLHQPAFALHLGVREDGARLVHERAVELLHQRALVVGDVDGILREVVGVDDEELQLRPVQLEVEHRDFHLLEAELLGERVVHALHELLDVLARKEDGFEVLAHELRELPHPALQADGGPGILHRLRARLQHDVELGGIEHVHQRRALGAEVGVVHLVLGKCGVVGVLLARDLRPELGRHLAALAHEAVQFDDGSLVHLLLGGDTRARGKHHGADLAHDRLAQDLALHGHDLVGQEFLELLDAALADEAGVLADLAQQRLLRGKRKDALLRKLQCLRRGFHHAQRGAFDLLGRLQLVPHEVDLVEHRDLLRQPRAHVAVPDLQVALGDTRVDGKQEEDGVRAGHRRNRELRFHPQRVQARRIQDRETVGEQRVRVVDHRIAPRGHFDELFFPGHLALLVHHRREAQHAGFERIDFLRIRERR